MMHRSPTTHAVRTELDVVTVEGPEAASYLHGQLSQDVEGLTVGATTWTFVLAPDGKVDALVRLHRDTDQRFRLLVDAGHGEDVAARLNRFKLRTKCEITAETVPALVVRGPGADEIDHPDAVDAAWPIPGVDVLATDVRLPDAVVEGDGAVLAGLRIVAGVPAMGVEVTPGSLAASSGMVDRAVDFSKGCFTGQELVARMNSRGGTAPTRLVRLRGEGEPPPAGADVIADGDVIGTVQSTAAHPEGQGWVAFASVSRRLPTDARAVVEVNDGPVDVDELVPVR